MEIISLVVLDGLSITHKEYKAYSRFKLLLVDIRDRQLTDVVIGFINDQVKLVNHAINNKFEVQKVIRSAQKTILSMLEKELKLVCKNHYQSRWMAIGMLVFGIPIGFAYNNMMGNVSGIGMGIAIGIGAGIAIGSSLDKKAEKEGRQLNITL